VHEQDRHTTHTDTTEHINTAVK